MNTGGGVKVKMEPIKKAELDDIIRAIGKADIELRLAQTMHQANGHHQEYRWAAEARQGLDAARLRLYALYRDEWVEESS